MQQGLRKGGDMQPEGPGSDAGAMLYRRSRPRVADVPVCTAAPKLRRARPQLGSAVAVALLLPAACATPDRAASEAQTKLIQSFSAHGAAEVRGHAVADGGTRIVGRLNGRRFAMAVPASWNRQALLFAGGYTTPGTPTDLPDDPIAKDPAFGVLGHAYGEGFAVGYIAYDKSGIGTESGVRNILALRDLLAQLGATRTYISGGSMGGSVVMGAIDTAPGAFAGALSACGVVDGWPSLLTDIIDLRAAYIYFTKGTEYALPGKQDLARSGLSTRPPFMLGFAGNLYRMWQLKRAITPVDRLFKAAKAKPDGPEAAIIRNIASVSGAYPADVLAFAVPLSAAVLGMDDIRASFGGMPYDNVHRVYRSAFLDAAGNAALNAGIQRLAGDPAAIMRARAWHQSTGRSPVKLVTIHNAVDALVPATQQARLVERMQAAGNASNVVAYTVPKTIVTVPGIDIRGLSHCGFTPAQMVHSWDVLRRWVETGRRP